MPIIAFITVAGFFTAVVLCAIWWYVPKLQMRGLNIEDAKDRASVEDNFRKTIGQVIGGAAVLVGAGAAYLQFNQQQQAAREQLQAANDLRISNQVAKGFEQLTGDKLVLRLAGIFGLEGVMNASSDYYRTVLEALCAFVRDGTSSMSVGERPPTDIQAALTVIGRRKGEEANLGAATSTFEVTIAAAIGERWADTEAAAGRGSVRLEGARIPGVDLRGANLSGANLSKVDLSGANLSGANLSKVDLSGANLSDANLSDANLSDANLRAANLSKTKLYRATLRAAILINGNLSKASLAGANLMSSVLIGADLSGAYPLTGANMSDADLSNANLSGASPDRKGVPGLQEAFSLTQVQLDQACGQPPPKNLPAHLRWGDTHRPCSPTFDTKKGMERNLQ